MSDTRAASPSVDLSRLLPPLVVQPLAYEATLDQLKQALSSRLPGFDAFLESDPAVKILQIYAERELLTIGQINDAARSLMLAFSRGADLDHLAAFYGVARLEISPATQSTPAVLERDEDLRHRCQLAPEGLPYAGMTGGGYVFRALTAAPSLKHVAPIRRGGGRVDLILLGRDGDGAVPAEVVSQVFAAFQDEDAVQLTDILTVRSAAIVPYSAAITLQLRPGPDPHLVKSAAAAAVRAYAAERHRVGEIVYARKLEAAASVGGVEQAIVDIGDVDPGADGAAFLEALTVSTQVLG